MSWKIDNATNLRKLIKYDDKYYKLLFINDAVGAKCLHMAQLQLNLLKQSEEETREAMKEWHDLCHELRGRQSENFKECGFDTSTCIDACQMGMRLISQQITSMVDPFGLEDADQEVVSIKSLAQDIQKTNRVVLKEGSSRDQQSNVVRDRVTLEQLAKV